MKIHIIERKIVDLPDGRSLSCWPRKEGEVPKEIGEMLVAQGVARELKTKRAEDGSAEGK